jgi:hypothetical protein
VYRSIVYAVPIRRRHHHAPSSIVGVQLQAATQHTIRDANMNSGQGSAILAAVQLQAKADHRGQEKQRTPNVLAVSTKQYSCGSQRPDVIASKSVCACSQLPPQQCT